MMLDDIIKFETLEDMPSFVGLGVAPTASTPAPGVGTSTKDERAVERAVEIAATPWLSFVRAAACK